MIILPDHFESPQDLPLRTQEPIRAFQYRQMAESTQYAWARLISQFGGEYVGGTSWKTTSGTYTQTPSNEDFRHLDMSTRRHAGVARHVLKTGDVEIGGELYGLNIDARVTVTNLETGNQLQGSATTSSGPEWITPSVTGDLADDGSGNPALVVVEWEFLAQDTSTDAEWWALRSGEIHSSAASDIPTS